MISLVAPAVVSNIANRWVLGDFLCGFSAYFHFLPASCNLILVSMLSANKLFRCLFPMRTLSVRTFHGVLACGVAWFLSTVMPLEFIILKRGYYFYISINRCYIKDYVDSAAYWRNIDLLSAFLFIAVPIITLTISNIWLLFIVFRKHLLQRSTIVMVLTVSVVFWLSWVWMVVYMVMQYNSRTIWPWIVRMMHNMIWLNSWANPILYILTNKSFKEYIKSITSLNKFRCAREMHNSPRQRGVITNTTTLEASTELVTFHPR